MKHWVYRFVGTYDGLTEDMDRIGRAPGIEIINVQRVSDAGKRVAMPEGGYQYEYEYLIYTRRAL